MKTLLLATDPARVELVARVLAGAESVIRSHETEAAQPEVVVALDASSARELEKQPASAARVVAALQYGIRTEDGWLDCAADAFLAGHPLVMAELCGAGAEPDRVTVVGVPVPQGFEPSADRCLAREAVGIGRNDRVVAIAPECLGDGAFERALIQLDLVRNFPWILFDVGNDPDLADLLRHAVPHHGLKAKMFCAGARQGDFYSLADLVVGPTDPFAFARAAAVGAAYLGVGGPGRVGLMAAIDAGAARVCDGSARLAVDVESILLPERLGRARQAAQRLATPSAASEIALALQKVADERESLVARRAGPRGLPQGLEDISSPRAGAERPRPPEPDIDAELAALKSKIDAKS